jgi:TIR domain
VFDAFISYSHAADGALAAALQQGLHRFAKPVFKLRAIRVFRDETTLAMTPKLWPEIEKALRDSRFFILMADPLSAKLEWVHKEVGCWLGMERADSMLIVWTGGRSPGTRPKTTLTGTAPLPCHRCLLGHSKVMSLFITISVGLERNCISPANTQGSRLPWQSSQLRYVGEAWMRFLGMMSGNNDEPGGFFGWESRSCY